ncbi:hypothetical protein C8Q77DRAFT_1162076 [Trametes polyzona]|nr:hypothetical protein C8Q77DRAFT_1162076 [Trametes polyzona]
MPAYRTRDAPLRSKSPAFPLSRPGPLRTAHNSTQRKLTDASPACACARPTALEVSTDAPLPPTVSIISPTPRAFTFPINDTRFPTTPSSSPFEPTLKSIPSTPPPVRPFSPTSSIGSDSTLSVPDSASVFSAPESTLSVPDSYVYSSPSAPASSQGSSHRRRRSTASDIGERRPKKGDDDYIKRPENAFILFRRAACGELQAARGTEGASGPVKKERQADLSKTISQQWKSLTPEERQKWEDLAKEKKKEHEAMYPNYVYRPQRNKGKKNKKGKSRKCDEQDTDGESFSFLLPVSSPSRSLSRDNATGGHGHGRRAVSAPTPPAAFQTIQLPTVWMPSCPTSPHNSRRLSPCPASPTLVPRISGRSPAPIANIPPPTESAPLTTLDYAPHDDLFLASCETLTMYDENGQPINVPYQNMHYQMSANDGPLVQSLSIPRDSCSMPHNMMSPAESIASTLVSPSECSTLVSPSECSTLVSPSDYSEYSMASSSTCASFTPQDALRMMSLSLKDVPENVGAEDDLSDLPMPYSFWPAPDTLWANMDTLVNEDFNIGSIPPVELGLAQFEALTAGSSSSSSSSSCTIQPDAEAERERYEHEQFEREQFDQHDPYAPPMPEEHDFHVHDATPGLEHYPGVYAHDSMNW